MGDLGSAEETDYGRWMARRRGRRFPKNWRVQASHSLAINSNSFEVSWPRRLGHVHPQGMLGTTDHVALLIVLKMKLPGS